MASSISYIIGKTPSDFFPKYLWYKASDNRSPELTLSRVCPDNLVFRQNNLCKICHLKITVITTKRSKSILPNAQFISNDRFLKYTKRGQILPLLTRIQIHLFYFSGHGTFRQQDSFTIIYW